MIKQNYEIISESIKQKFIEKKRETPLAFRRRLSLSWSNWGFGLEPLEKSLERLSKHNVKFIELHGNHYGPDLGYKAKEVNKKLKDYGISVSGICGMFSEENDLASNRPLSRQNAISYIKRELEFAAEVDGKYLLIVPGAVGRPIAYDEYETSRSAQALSMLSSLFISHGIKGAIEPIRSAEVSIVHTVKEAIEFINAVNSEGISHINGDLYHMLTEESHMGEAILEAEGRLINLHLADSNRLALGKGCLDLDTCIMALYLTNHNSPGRFVTAEPLGPSSNPYPAMNGVHDNDELDEMVKNTASYFREREEAVLAL